MRRSLASWSPKTKKYANQHPKNTVRWNPNTSGFYRPKLGASKMKWNYTLPYGREVNSLLHYPEVSRVTGKPVDWKAEPQDGYDGVRIYGENTLELSGMPPGRTPEYMQERLRRFFSKFGPIKHCRAEPHSHDPYQCEGTAYVTFRDKEAALKALKAPLKFPASLHDKIVGMRHLDTDKKNDTDYYEKAKFWNAQLISLARQLHAQLSGDSELQTMGKPLATIGSGLFERELVSPPSAPAPLPWGRGGVPFSKGLVGTATRQVSAGPSVAQRFGSWAAFLAEAPLDELFRLERQERSDLHKADGIPAPPEASLVPADEDAVPAPASASPPATPTVAESSEGAKETIVVRPRLVSTVQRARILTRARVALASRLHDEFSVWWRTGKVPLPEFTQRRITWWDHKPVLPFDLQILSRSKDRHRIFDERYLHRHQLQRARTERRKQRRDKWAEERKEALADKAKQVEERRSRALSAIQGSSCAGLLGLSRGLVPRGGQSSPGWSRGRRTQNVDAGEG